MLAVVCWFMQSLFGTVVYSGAVVYVVHAINHPDVSIKKTNIVCCWMTLACMTLKWKLCHFVEIISGCMESCHFVWGQSLIHDLSFVVVMLYTILCYIGLCFGETLFYFFSFFSPMNFNTTVEVYVWMKLHPIKQMTDVISLSMLLLQLTYIT